MKRYLNFITILILYCLIYPAYPKLVEYKNKYLRLLVDDINFRFTLQREFLPSKEYSKDLLFFNVPPTSYVSFKVDNLTFKPNEGIVKQGVNLEGKELRFTTLVDGIEFGVVFSFVDNYLSKVNDCLKIEILVVNTTNVSKRISVRYLLDTLFGENENLPKFFLDGKTAIDYELILDNNNMVSYVVSSSDIEKVNNLYIYWNGLPSRILFSNWRKLDNSDWFVEPSSFLRYRFSETSGEDCAVAIFFEETTLYPNQSTNFIIFLSTTPFSPAIQAESQKEDKVIFTLTQEPDTNTNQPLPPSIIVSTNVIITNFVFITNELPIIKTQEIITSNEIRSTNQITNLVYITNLQTFQDQDEIKRKISEIESRLYKLTESIDLMFNQITNLTFYQKAKEDKEIQKDIEEMKKIKITMAKLTKTLDTIEERIAIINRYIEIRKRFSEKMLIVYTDKEYKQDLKLIEETEKLLDEILNSIIY